MTEPSRVPNRNAVALASAQTVVDALERDLIKGRARWVADLTEFFRGYKLGDTTFELYARGRTRNRGFLLSKFFSWTALPNYSVSLFCLSEDRLSIEKLRERMEAVIRVIREEDLHWVWLIVFCAKELPAQVVAFVSRYDRRELGIAVASTKSGQIAVSANQIGLSIVKHLKLDNHLRRLSGAASN